MTNQICSLCGSKKLLEEKSVASSRLVTAYNDSYHVDISGYLQGPRLNTYRCTECDLRTHYPATSGDSDFYDRMQELAFYYEEEKPEFSYAMDKLIEHAPARVLEVGCGEGNFLKKIKDAYNVFGSEFSRKSIAKLKEAGIALDDGTGTYDFIVTFQVLEHVSDVKGFLRSAVDKLEDGGYLLITVPNRESKLLSEKFAPLDYPPHHMTQWSKAALNSIASQFDLDIVDYYLEPHRIEHYQGLITGRRMKISNSSLSSKLAGIAARLLDPVLAPYFLDLIDYPGMTHGMLFQKSGA